MKAKDLAELLGVSTATISLVLNNKPGISDELRQALLTKIREMGCGHMIKNEQPARDTEAQTKKIAYVIYADEAVGEEESAFFPPVLEGVEREARVQGYQLMVIHMNGMDRDVRLKELCEECSGVIVQCPRLDDDAYSELEETGLPYITADCYTPDREISGVCVNNEQGMLKAVSYLKQLGHSRIGYIRTENARKAYEERHKYFRLALLELGLSYREEWDLNVRRMDHDMKSCLEKHWITKGDVMPTAIVLENDILGPPVFHAFRAAGIRIPQDVSVIGFDGRAVCSLMEPELTTVRVPRRFFGRALMTLLSQCIEQHNRGMENVSVKVEVDVELVVMNSTMAIGEL